MANLNFNVLSSTVCSSNFLSAPSCQESKEKEKTHGSKEVSLTSRLEWLKKRISLLKDSAFKELEDFLLDKTTLAKEITIRRQNQATFASSLLSFFQLQKPDEQPQFEDLQNIEKLSSEIQVSWNSIIELREKEALKILEGQGKGKAFEYYILLEKITPDRETIRLALSELYCDIAEYEKGRILCDGFTSARARLKRIEILLAQNNPQGAFLEIEGLEKFNSLTDQEKMALSQLQSRAFSLSGQFCKAVCKAWEKVKENPKNEELIFNFINRVADHLLSKEGTQNLFDHYLPQLKAVFSQRKCYPSMLARRQDLIWQEWECLDQLLHHAPGMLSYLKEWAFKYIQKADFFFLETLFDWTKKRMIAIEEQSEAFRKKVDSDLKVLQRDSAANDASSARYELTKLKMELQDLLSYCERRQEFLSFITAQLHQSIWLIPYQQLLQQLTQASNLLHEIQKKLRS